MKAIEVDKSWDGRRLTRFLQKTMPAASMGQLRRFLRLGRIKVDKRRGSEDTVLHAGALVEMYVEDAWFEQVQKEDPFYSRIRPKLTILYEDEQVMLLDKRAGLICHPDEGEKVHTLLTYAQAYLYQKGEWNPRTDFAPALCNRIDRGTGGIVIAAKTAEALRILDDKIRSREIDKEYLCVCLGTPSPPTGTLTDWLFKDAVKNQVFVKPRQEPGASIAVTDYAVLGSRNGLSLVECRLHTGRTHQIRVQMAHAGHPLLGDSKYGVEKMNRRYSESRQLLWSYKLTFSFTTDAGALQYLNGRVFTVRNVPFAEKYFPDLPMKR